MKRPKHPSLSFIPSLKRRFLIPALSCVPLLVSFAALRAADLTLWYDKPALDCILEGVPIGNGPMGAMIFGTVDVERVQFNADTLWTGDRNLTGFFQNFGELTVDFSGSRVTAGSPQKSENPKEGIEASVDGSSISKWSVNYEGKEVIWAKEFPLGKRRVSHYTITSAKDAAERDPKDWVLEGSVDGTNWVSVDQRQGEAFAKREMLREFDVANPDEYRFYRFRFAPTGGDGASLSLGELDFRADDPPATEYRRELDLERAVYRTSYVLNGVKFTREMFASHPARVIALRFTADKPGAYSGVIGLQDAHTAPSKAAPGGITISGTLPNGQQYEGQVRVIADGGALRVRGDGIEFSKANAFTLLLSAETDYCNDETRQWKGDPPGPKVAAELDAAAAKGFDALLAEHVADYQPLFRRCQLVLAGTPPELAVKPTDERLRLRSAKTKRQPRRTAAERYLNGVSSDPGQDALFFEFGRYLMISCSRPGDLPANLQGVWNNSNTPRWHSDYHSNINVQMNYWPVEVTNLAELHTPFFDYVNSQIPANREHTRKEYGEKVRGWTVRTENGVFGGGSYLWNPPGSAWYALHYWEHYAFGGDKTFLREAAYPVLKEVCEFWDDVLIRHPDGTLVTPVGWSPEHGPTEEALSYDLEWVYDLFTHYVEAADILGLDKPFRDKVAEMRGKLLRPKIGKWGQLQEWETDRDDPKDGHRHVSHLVGVFPSDQITSASPKLFEAAKVSLQARGDGGTPWSKAWKACLWARYKEGDHAYSLFRGVLNYANQVGPYKNRASGVTPNLLGLHSPFQIDANFGATAAVAEMLLQSHEGPIHLLPALPQAWPEGSITGLRARGGFEVDLAWKEGKLTAATIRSVNATGGTARYAGKTIDLNLRPGKAVHLSAKDFQEAP